MILDHIPMALITTPTVTGVRIRRAYVYRVVGGRQWHPHTLKQN